MTYTLSNSLALGSGLTGITSDLRGQLVDTAGSNVGSAITTGFTEIGAGNYIHSYSSYPDGHQGGMKYYRFSTSAVLAFVAINPQEVEYTDTKTSTRLASAVYTAPDNATITSIYGVVDTEVGAIKTVTDHIATAIELDGAVYRFTTNALEQAPTGSAPTAGDVADAVWDELLSGHVISGSAGDGLSNASAAGNPLDQDVPGTFDAGTAGYALGQVQSIKTKIDLINPLAVTVQSAVGTNNNVTIRWGDAYTADSSWGPLAWIETTGGWLTLVGKTAVFTAGDISASAVFSVVSGNTVKCTVELESADTASVPTTDYVRGAGRITRKYDIQATLSAGIDVTPVSGILTVLQDVTPPSA